LDRAEIIAPQPIWQFWILRFGCRNFFNMSSCR
jgi:hypothetical protein